MLRRIFWVIACACLQFNLFAFSQTSSEQNKSENSAKDVVEYALDFAEVKVASVCEDGLICDAKVEYSDSKAVPIFVTVSDLSKYKEGAILQKTYKHKVNLADRNHFFVLKAVETKKKSYERRYRIYGECTKCKQTTLKMTISDYEDFNDLFSGKKLGLIKVVVEQIMKLNKMQCRKAGDKPDNKRLYTILHTKQETIVKDNKTLSIFSFIEDDEDTDIATRKLFVRGYLDSGSSFTLKFNEKMVSISSQGKLPHLIDINGIEWEDLSQDFEMPSFFDFSSARQVYAIGCSTENRYGYSRESEYERSRNQSSQKTIYINGNSDYYNRNDDIVPFSFCVLFVSNNETPSK